MAKRCKSDEFYDEQLGRCLPQGTKYGGIILSDDSEHIEFSFCDAKSRKEAESILKKKLMEMAKPDLEEGENPSFNDLVDMFQGENNIITAHVFPIGDGRPDYAKRVADEYEDD
jgi:hypothetical protein